VSRTVTLDEAPEALVSLGAGGPDAPTGITVIDLTR